jgi:acylphosphatase
MRQAKIIVTGTVQGVFYRYSTKKKADEFGLRGTVRNLPDGRVEVVCEGDEKAVQRLIEWCRQGPRGAVVRDVAIEWKEVTNTFENFSILY